MTWLRRVLAWLGRWTGTTKPLCDSCRYDYGDVCRRPERPNARVCGEYRPK